MSEPRRLRFSLATLLLVTTIAAMAITITLLMREIGPLRAEVKKLREETGKLWIEDETKIHAIRIPSVETWLHRIRLKLPKERKYQFCYAVNDIPEKGLPTANATVAGDLPSGELVCQIHFDQGRSRAGELAPYGIFDCEFKGSGPPKFSSGYSVGVAEVKNDWIINKQTKNSLWGADSVGMETEEFEPDQPVVIYRARASKIKQVHMSDPDGRATSYSTEDFSEPCDGFMLWIEPVK
jgi:hypothetical protein